jgi:uncharacterized protein (DUF362 family)
MRQPSYHPSRRELLASFLAARAAAADPKLPAEPVVIAKCPSYDQDQAGLLKGMFGQLGGLERLVRNKTVTVKLNLTGSPALRLKGRPLGSTHYSHPKQIAAFTHLLGEAGAKRIRLVESAWGTAGPLDEYMLDSGWNVRQILGAAPDVELVNTNGLTWSGKYVKFPVRSQGAGKAEIFPSYTLHPVYEQTDVFVSMAKLKEHANCGVTLASKNIFGITPASIYGDDAGVDEPNERPTAGRASVCHFGKRQPAKIADAEIDPQSSREANHRMPRITAELIAARPVHISIIDGIETMDVGEGPWIKRKDRPEPKPVAPGVMIVGTNPVNTDAVAAAVMGFDPRESRGKGAFRDCDNFFLFAEALGVGTADLNRIEVRGVKIEDAMYRFAG